MLFVLINWPEWDIHLQNRIDCQTRELRMKRLLAFGFLIGILLGGCSAGSDQKPSIIPSETMTPALMDTQPATGTPVVSPSFHPQLRPTKTEEPVDEPELNQLLTTEIGNKSRIWACLKRNDGSILAASEDGLWRWSPDAWEKTDWKTGWPQTLDGMSNIAITVDDQDRVWAASTLGLIMYDGGRWYSIASPLDNLINLQSSPNFGESDNRDFSVKIYLTSGQDGSIWMLIRVFPIQDDIFYRYYSIVAKVDEDSYEILSSANEVNFFENISVIDEQTIWGSYIEWASESQWADYVWDGQQWEEAVLYPGVEGKILESYNPREGQAWVLTGPKRAQENDEGQSPQAPQNHTYRIYHWDQGVWSLVSSFESPGDYYYSTLMMTDAETGWLLLNFRDVDASQIISIKGKQTRIYSIMLPDGASFIWPLCPISEDAVYLFGKDAFSDGVYDFLFQAP
jgi:hypothetical protein